MSRIPYYDAGKGDTPRSCNSAAYLKNYEMIFKKKQKKQNEMPCKDSENSCKGDPIRDESKDRTMKCSRSCGSGCQKGNSAKKAP